MASSFNPSGRVNMILILMITTVALTQLTTKCNSINLSEIVSNEATVREVDWLPVQCSADIISPGPTKECDTLKIPGHSGKEIQYFPCCYPIRSQKPTERVCGCCPEYVKCEMGQPLTQFQKCRLTCTNKLGDPEEVMYAEGPESCTGLTGFV